MAPSFQKILKAHLPRNGMAWGEHDHVMRTRRHDGRVRDTLECLGVAMRRREVEPALTKLVEAATKRAEIVCSKDIVMDEVKFLEGFYNTQDWSDLLPFKHFVELFHTLIRARLNYLEERKQRGRPINTESHSILAKALDEFLSTSRGRFSEADLFLQMECGALESYNTWDDTDDDDNPMWADEGTDKHAKDATDKDDEDAHDPSASSVEAPGSSSTAAATSGSSTVASSSTGNRPFITPEILASRGYFAFRTDDDSPDSQYDSDEFAGVPPSTDEEDEGNEEEETEEVGEIRRNMSTMELSDPMEVDEE